MGYLEFGENKGGRHSWMSGVVFLCMILWNWKRHNILILCEVVSQPSSANRLFALVNLWAPVTFFDAVFDADSDADADE